MVVILLTTSNRNQNPSLQLSWVPFSGFAGDIEGVQVFNQNNESQLDLYFGGPGINPIQLVTSGQRTFGWAGADEILIANEQGADLVMIGVIHDTPPAGYVSLKETNITTPSDFEGRRVGLLPFGNTSMIYEAMLLKNNIDRRSIDEITISGDLRPFLERQYDVQPVFVHDELIQLEMQGIDFNVILPEEFGVDMMKGYVYFTRRSTLENNPELVRNFVFAMAEGFNRVIEDPTNALNILQEKESDLDMIFEEMAFQAGLPYISGYQGLPLYSNIDSWDAKVQEMLNLGLLNNEVNMSDVLFLDFVREFYQQ